MPRGLLHQGLLDAAIQVIPHDNLWTWSDQIGRDVAGFPHRIVTFDVMAPLPEVGEVRVAASFVGFDAGQRSRPVFDVVLWDERRTYATLRLVDALVPKGRVGTANPVDRRVFLRARGRDHVARIAVADHVGRLAGVHPADVVVADDLSYAWPAPNPGRRVAVSVKLDGDEVTVRGEESGILTPSECW